jgi:hypothetical protein
VQCDKWPGGLEDSTEGLSRAATARKDPDGWLAGLVGRLKGCDDKIITAEEGASNAASMCLCLSPRLPKPALPILIEVSAFHQGQSYDDDVPNTAYTAYTTTIECDVKKCPCRSQWHLLDRWSRRQPFSRPIVSRLRHRPAMTGNE